MRDSFYQIKQEEEMLRSLANAVRDAGGAPERFLNPDITLGELVQALAPNGVRFRVKPRETDSLS